MLVLTSVQCICTANVCIAPAKWVHQLQSTPYRCVTLCAIGQGSLKATDLYRQTSELAKEENDGKEGTSSTPRPRRKYSDGYKSRRSSYSNESAQRIILLGIAFRNSSESNAFVSDFVEELGIDLKEWIKTGDLKVIAEMVGIQTASSSYPSPFCDFKKGSTQETFPLRTFESIRENNLAWIKSRKPRRCLPEFKSCSGQPCSTLPEKGYVIDEFGVPTMHVTMGLVNKTVSTMEQQVPEVCALISICSFVDL